jgi:hypothetical protein
MLNEFLYWGSPRSAASRKLRDWLDHRSPGLAPSLRKIDLRRPVFLHKTAKHGSDTPLSWSDAADMARLSRGLLSTIIGHEPDGGEEVIRPRAM